MRVRRAIASGCALIAVAAAYSSSNGSAKAPATTTRPAASSTTGSSTSTTVAPSTVPTTPPPLSLPALILSEVPGGFALQPDDVADTGPTNLAKAALDDVGCNATCNARKVLVDAGFVRGYQRQWTGVDANGDALNQDFVFLYQFRTPEGAQAYAQHWRVTLLTTNQGAALLSFTPALIPGANGLRVQDKLGSTGIVFFAKGPYAVQALVNGGPDIDQSGPASQLAAQQYLRLP